ncbi:enoyl-CoA hydratase/carnithine racemase [Microbacterium trichothecenolyticum]|uniref:enoyl-CoA hydratase/isomerase family protein n=1 Tax=Microbacterium trichothecenolyticum TaxID=69370 RepID=UPI002862DAB0|nr:enoyl-CoA hydratase/isomerase family protein [Microbacterium trichothecenolyticum]MDR7112250.1 enoyl-CoA hydratase/carnithine racemase [Microbacterium trichothecenolyticum]
MTDDRLAALPQSEDLLLGSAGSSLIVTLNRPSRANALTESMMDDLRSLWRAVADADWVRSVIVTGAGAAFCAGADAGMLAQPRTRIGRDAAEELSFVPGPHLGVPVIVAVNGVCAGGGLHFVADADLCIAADTARFVDPHVTVGQVSGMEPVELMLKARRDVIVRMALLGRAETLDAAHAKDAGLVSEVVPADSLLAHATALGERIATGSREAIRATRAVIRDFEADLMRRHMDAGWQAVQDHWPHPDAHEGPQAFLEKRAPRWSGSN